MLWPLLLLGFLTACQDQVAAMILPTRANAILTPSPTTALIGLIAAAGMPPTWTPQPEALVPTATRGGPGYVAEPTRTPLPIPTNTPYTPPPTKTPTPEPTPTPAPTRTPGIKSFLAYRSNEVIPLQAFPRPASDNGWGMHWIPTVKQEPAVVDRFVVEMIKMRIKWVVFLNDGTNIGDNDYLVDRLTRHGIMPVMRVYRSTITPHDGDLGAMVRHYRARGVYYFQLYNEPNANVENGQGFANPNHYAAVWAGEARKVIANGGLPGFGAFSPGGAYDHYAFLDRTLHVLKYNGDEELLNWAWLSVHNYHGTRPHHDPEGFLLFRNYDTIVRNHLGRSIPMIGTEGGSYSDDPGTVTRLAAFQYNYMSHAEPYFFAFSWWTLANRLGGGADSTWEWQALFRENAVHPVVTEFFYRED